MNVDDIQEVPPHEGHRLAKMFDHQRELAKRYHHVEITNGLRVTPDVPVSLDDRLGQYVLKDFAWRVTEELTEAQEALREHPHLPQHALEELADAAHFLLELTILAGIEDKVMSQWRGDPLVGLVVRLGQSPRDTMWETVCRLGEAMNCLKNKPWKQTHLLTDRTKFSNLIVSSYEWFFPTFAKLGLNADQVYEMYFKKAAVNGFRLRSGY